jgi:Putative peptidoglycan binding domain
VAFLLPLGAMIVAPGAAYASSCVARGDWSNNCTTQSPAYSNLVVAIQFTTGRVGCGPGNIDGSFGQQTYNAVICVQRNNGLSQDGIVGPKTWRALQSGLYYLGGQAGWSYWTSYYGCYTIAQCGNFRKWLSSDIWYFKWPGSRWTQMNANAPGT